MHAVIEAPTFIRAAEREGLSEAERGAIVDLLTVDPAAGDEIKGTGGCRKLRFPGRGKGKSGGYRVISFFSGDDIPVLLITVYSKGRKADLTGKERADLAELGRSFVAAFRAAEGPSRRQR